MPENYGAIGTTGHAGGTAPTSSTKTPPGPSTPSTTASVLSSAAAPSTQTPISTTQLPTVRVVPANGLPFTTVIPIGTATPPSTSQPPTRTVRAVPAGGLPFATDLQTASIPLTGFASLASTRTATAIDGCPTCASKKPRAAIQQVSSPLSFMQGGNVFGSGILALMPVSTETPREKDLADSFENVWAEITSAGSIRLCDASDDDLLKWLMKLTPGQRDNIGAYLRLVARGGYSLGGSGDSAYSLDEKCIKRIEGIWEQFIARYTKVFNDLRGDDTSIRLDRASDSEIIAWLAQLDLLQFQFLIQYLAYLEIQGGILGGAFGRGYYVTPGLITRISVLMDNPSAIRQAQLTLAAKLSSADPIKNDNPVALLNYAGKPTSLNLKGGPCFDHEGKETKWKKIVVEIENYSGLPNDHPNFLGFVTATEKNTNAILNKCCIYVEVVVKSKPESGWRGANLISIDSGRTDGMPERHELTIQNPATGATKVIDLGKPENKGTVGEGKFKAFVVAGSISWFPGYGGGPIGAVGIAHNGIGNKSGAVAIGFDFVPLAQNVHPGGNLAHEIGHDLGLFHPDEEPDKDPLAASDDFNFMNPGSQNPTVDPVNDNVTARQCMKMRLPLP